MTTRRELREIKRSTEAAQFRAEIKRIDEDSKWIPFDAALARVAKLKVPLLSASGSLGLYLCREEIGALLEFLKRLGG